MYKIRDSKMLTEPEREALFQRVADWCEAWAVGHAVPGNAMNWACPTLSVSPHAEHSSGLGVAARCRAGRRQLGLRRASTPLRRSIRGDATSLSIAAASILAKVTRDRILRDEAQHYVGFNFAHNKGYPCPRHKAALARWGPTVIHRGAGCSWITCRGTVLRRYERPDPQGSPVRDVSDGRTSSRGNSSNWRSACLPIAPSS